MINLLPSQYKKELRKEEQWKLVLILGTLYLFFLISLLLILFSVEIYIQGQAKFWGILRSFEEKALQEEKEKSLFEKIGEANKNLSGLNNFYKNQINSLVFFEKILKTLPDGIYLTDFSWQKEGLKISLSGKAKNRETLFELKNNLEEQKDFKEINFPVESWIKPSDVNFQTTFQLSPVRNFTSQ